MATLLAWRDKHLKTCACRKCEARPSAPDPTLISARARGSEHHDDIVFDGKSPFFPELDLPAAPPPSPVPAVTLKGLAAYFEKWELKVPSPSLHAGDGFYVSSPAWSFSGLKVDFSVTADTLHTIQTFWSTAAAAATWAAPAEPPTVELLDSGNPFSRALDAWQTGKAGWVKGQFFTRQPQQEEASA